MPESSSGVLNLLEVSGNPTITTHPLPRPLLWLSLEGQDTEGNEVLERLAEAEPLSIDQLQTGLNEIVPRQSLKQLANDSTFRISAKISFDGDPDESTAISLEPLELRILHEDVVELTTFDDRTLGGWEVGPGGAQLEFQTDPRGGYFLYTKTTGTVDHSGIVLVKNFTVIPGKSYEFSIETRKERSESEIAARLILFFNDLHSEVFSIQHTAWATNSFTLSSAASSTVRIGVINETRGSSGNEFALDNLKVSRLS